MLLGILGGAVTAFGAAVSNAGTYAIVNPAMVRVVSGILFAFTIGLVLLMGGQLFTGNALMIVSVPNRKNGLSSMARNLFFVYLGNFAGAFLISETCWAGC